MIQFEYRLLVLAVCICAGIANCVFSRQSADNQDAQQVKPEKQFKYSGSLECTVCHVAPAAKYALNNVSNFVFLNEYKIWINEDPHSTSFLSIIPDKQHFDAVVARRSVLNAAIDQPASKLEIIPNQTESPGWGESNEKSMAIIQKVSGATVEQIGKFFQRMSDERGLLAPANGPRDFPDRLATTVRNCLTCHAGLKLNDQHDAFENVEFETGVNCEACHGPSSEWINVHQHSQWRTREPRIKAEEFGLYNTRQPIARAQLCYSCHIGDAKQGRVVTHEMYAAGHPHLSSIEIESFADQIPRHWRYLTEKEDFEFSQEFISAFCSDLKLEQSSIKYEMPRTKNMLVGAVMASAQSIQLLVDSADEFLLNQNRVADQDFPGRLVWPDYATFDCASCHHDLKTSSDYRSVSGIPGRPPAVRWPTAMTKLAIAYLGDDNNAEYADDLYSLPNQVQKVLDQQPFGRPERLVESGKRHYEWLHGIARQLQSQPLTRDDAVEVLQLLCGGGENPIFDPVQEEWDFHSARQLVWAIDVVYSELMQSQAPGQRQVDNPFSLPREFANGLEKLKSSVLFELAEPGDFTASQTRYLNTWRDFDHRKFTELIKSLSE